MYYNSLPVFMAAIQCLFLMSCGAQFSPSARKANSPKGEIQLTGSQSCGTEPPSNGPSDDWGSTISMSEISAKLSGHGLEGWIHGAAPAFGHYVFTYRDPNDFFNHVELPLIPATDAVAATLSTLHRHDRIVINGSFVQHASPLRHIRVTTATMIEPYAGGTTGGYAHETSVDLAQFESQPIVHVVVHTPSVDGRVLVIEYGDAVLPVVVSSKHQKTASQLFRGDIIKIHLRVQAMPSHVRHLITNPLDKHAIKVIDHVAWCNRRAATMTGELVRFATSPQIPFAVFALRMQDSNGLSRNWTLVHFANPDVFAEIRAKLEAAWVAGEETIEQGRNQLLNRSIRVTATGTMNITSPVQANPQILLTGPEAIVIH